MLSRIFTLASGTLTTVFLASQVVPALATDEVIWTTKPVRIDQSKQDFERLPPRENAKIAAEQKRLLIRLPGQITMMDSATFSARGRRYSFSLVRGLPPDKVCTSELGSKWRCGHSGAVFSGKLLRGQLVQCASSINAGGETRLSDCKVGSRSVEQEIVLNGQGFAADGNAELLQVMKDARQSRTGIWRDVTCFEKLGEC